MPKCIGVPDVHLAMQVAINGQDFWQSGKAGALSGQHGMSSVIADMATNISAEPAMAEPLIDAVNAPTTNPTTARIGSRLQSHALIFIAVTCHRWQAMRIR